MSIESIDAKLRLRRAGVYHLHVGSRDVADQVADHSEVLDRFASNLGFNKLGKGWVEVERLTAEMILIEVLHRDMAYDSAVMVTEDAKFAAEAFVQCFSQASRFFTNGTRGHIEPVQNDAVQFGPSWDPITSATFDAGVLAFDDTQIGILWVEDED